jgi:predicted ATP-grasp superfamily ATP-dependent carboligase
LSNHWKEWLPDFPVADLKTVDEGLQDEVPIVTTAAMEQIPKKKHSVDPDVLYNVQLKSSILELGVSCPKHMTENELTFPCIAKVDMSWSGRGNRLLKNKDEMSAVLKDIREECGWEKNIIFQELIEGIKEVPTFQFHLDKSGEIYWIGTGSGRFKGFKWTSGVVDWDTQEEYKNLVYDQFTIPIKNYLHKQGYFGLVTFEILITDHGLYLVDLNPRIGGDITYLLIAPYMAQRVNNS